MKSRSRKRVWVWRSLLAAALVGVILIVWSSVASHQRGQAYRAALNSLPGVAYVEYEMQHPGVPWNNSLVVMAAIDFQDEKAAAELITQLIDVSMSAGLADHYVTTLQVADSSAMSESQYSKRGYYFTYKSLPEGIRDHLGDRYKVFYNGVSLIPEKRVVGED